MSRIFFLLIFLPQLLFSQPGVLKGALLDQVTHAPIPNAHLKIRNTALGTVTGTDGSFTLSVTTLPAIVDFTCIGYDPIAIEIKAIPGEPRTFYLNPRTYLLEPVTISDKPAITLYKDEAYSVLDFDILDGNLILIVFRNQLKRSEIILMTTNGDTLDIVIPPSSPPMKLYKDVLGNVHYITKRDEALQAFYDPVQHRLTFPFRTSYDTIKKFLGGYRFLQGERLWFQEDSPYGFMTALGYYSRKEGKKNIFRSGDPKAMNTFYSESWFYHTNRPVPEPIDPNESRAVDADGIAYKHFFWEKGCGELFSIGDTAMAFFNFCKNRVEILDGEGKPWGVTPIDFHIEKSDGFITALTESLTGSDEWQWNHTLIQDGAFRKIYAVFTRNGFVLLKNIDLRTGRLTASAELPKEFPEKMKIFRGEVFFLYRGSHDNWFLAKCRLS